MNVSKELTNIFDTNKNYNLTRQKNKFAKLNSNLEELQSWQDDIATPKKLELCQKMQILAEDTQMDLHLKAEKIQILQKQWRDLGTSSLNDELWQNFKNYSQIAYAPCKKKFDLEKSIRTKNLEQKKIICKELEFLLEQDLSNLKTKDFYKIIQEVKRQWQQYSPLNTTDHAKIQPHYLATLNALYKKRDVINKDLRDKKLAILDKSNELLNSDATKFNDFKLLREQWFALDSLPYKEEQQKLAILNNRISQFLDKNQAIRQEQIKQQKEQEHKVKNYIDKLSAHTGDKNLEEFINDYQELENLLHQSSEKFRANQTQSLNYITNKLQKIELWIDYNAGKKINPNIITKTQLPAEEIQARLEIVLGDTDKSQDEVFQLQLKRLQHRKNLHIQDDFNEVKLLTYMWQNLAIEDSKLNETFSQTLKSYCLTS